MRYIVAVDGSSESKEAVEQAVEYAQATGANIEIVHVGNRNVEQTGEGRVLSSPEEVDQEGQEVLRRAEKWIDGRVGSVETSLLRGPAGPTVSEYANGEEVDAVFVGHRGLSQEHEEMVGSVAKTLIDQTRMPVVVVGGGD